LSPILQVLRQSASLPVSHRFTLQVNILDVDEASVRPSLGSCVPRWHGSSKERGWLPADLHHSDDREANEGEDVAQEGPDSDPPVSSTGRRYDCSSNWYTSQCAEGDDGIASSVVPSILLSLAQHADTYGCQTDVRPAQQARMDASLKLSITTLRTITCPLTTRTLRIRHNN
jgi:hypothetical protein